MKIKQFIKNHILGSLIVVSAIIQLTIMFFVKFVVGAAPDRKTEIVTILPYQEVMQQIQVKKVEKVIKETEDEASEEEETPDMKATQNTNEIPNFLPFVRVDEIAKATTSLEPKYPPAAREAGVEGTVVLEVYIDKDGKVWKVRLKRGIGFGCDEAAIRQVKRTRFIPAKMSGESVAVRQIITFEFRLE